MPRLRPRTDSRSTPGKRGRVVGISSRYRSSPGDSGLPDPGDGRGSWIPLHRQIAHCQRLHIGDRRIERAGGRLVDLGDQFTQQAIDLQFLLRQQHLHGGGRLLPFERFIERLLIGGVPLHQGKRTLNHLGCARRA